MTFACAVNGILSNIQLECDSLHGTASFSIDLGIYFCTVCVCVSTSTVKKGLTSSKCYLFITATAKIWYK